MHAIADHKQQIRAEVRARRAAFSSAARHEAACRITEHLISLVERVGARSLTCYSSVPTEPDTTEFLDWTLTQNLKVLLPISLPGAQLDWARYEPNALAPGRHGIQEPSGPRLGGAAAASTDLLILPACAVDPTGVRLGWGMGYYDRCLAQMSAAIPTYAVVFDEDCYQRLPSDPHDKRITGFISPSGITTAPSSTR